MEARHLRRSRRGGGVTPPVPPRKSRWSPWRSALAGAVIGFIEAAGSDPERSVLSRPAAVVRFDHRHPDSGAPPPRLWFLSPLGDFRRYLSRN